VGGTAEGEHWAAEPHMAVPPINSVALVCNGHPNDALKLFQLGQFRLGGSILATPRTDDPRLPTLTARLNRQSATTYALMGGPLRLRRPQDHLILFTSFALLQDSVAGPVRVVTAMRSKFLDDLRDLPALAGAPIKVYLVSRISLPPRFAKEGGRRAR
jgi:hypothetical protein